VVLKRISEPKRDEIIGGRNNLYNEELHKLYSPNLIRMIKSRGMRCAGHDMKELDVGGRIKL
jgi:hypothetical protein